MDVDLTGFYQISIALSEHYDSIYYVDVESENFMEFLPSKLFETIPHPKIGNDFFGYFRKVAPTFIHPNDVEKTLRIYDKNAIPELFATKKSYSISLRLILAGNVVHVRHVVILCEDRKHILCCLENTESEFQEKVDQNNRMRSVERMARRDELTGIKNKNAFSEQMRRLDDRIKAGDDSLQFGLVMCDMNNLKIINDTRGHSFGDEAIQKTSQMVCSVFKQSSVFRIGGDEFVVLLTGSDYERRDELFALLKEESLTNKKTRVGPVVACGLSVFNPDSDKSFSDVFNRADSLMYENKKRIKSSADRIPKRAAVIDTPITKERKRTLDGLFESYLTIVGEGYVFLNDMKYDLSRWAIALVDDFGLKSEYMVAADKIWEKLIHPDDLKSYQKAMEKILCGTSDLPSISYRVRNRYGEYVLVTFRGFVLNDTDNNSDYFGGIIVPK